MAQEPSLVETEFEEYAQDLATWRTELEARNIPNNQKGVVDRFLRDCDTLKNDMFSSEKPTSSDLIDFNDRFNMLEVQNHNLKKALP